LVAAGDRISAALSGASGVFVQSGTGPDGFPAFTEAAGTTAAAQAGMGVMHLDLRGIDAFGASTPVPDGVDEIILLGMDANQLGPSPHHRLGHAIDMRVVQADGSYADRRLGCVHDPAPLVRHAPVASNR
jgi:hypothetical protein